MTVGDFSDALKANPLPRMFSCVLRMARQFQSIEIHTIE
jgi:hypothetical protein